MNKTFNRSKQISSFILIITLVILVIPTNTLAAKKVKLNKTKIILNVGKTKLLKLKNNKKKIKWSSNKKKIATVTSKGKVIAKRKGTAIITAKVGKRKYKCKVMVKKKITNKSANPKSSQNVPQNTSADKQNIIDLTNIDSDKFNKETGRVKDSFANIYSNCYVTDTLNDTYVILYLAKKYKTLNLTIAPTEDRHSRTITYTQIYADDQLIYTSDDITKTTKPIRLNLNIANIDILKIVEKRTTLGDDDKPTLYAGYVSK